jgi:hypothetical protein
LRIVELICVDREFRAQDECGNHLRIRAQCFFDSNTRAFQIASFE